MWFDDRSTDKLGIGYFGDGDGPAIDPEREALIDAEEAEMKAIHARMQAERNRAHREELERVKATLPPSWRQFWREVA